MSEKTVRSCDICEADQAITNGWWAYWTKNNVFSVGHADEVSIRGVNHACGQLCIHKAQDAYFTSQTITPVADKPTQETSTPSQLEAEQTEIKPAIKTIGLTVEELVAEQGGNPEKAVYEGHIPLPCDEGEECRVIKTETAAAVSQEDDPNLGIVYDSNDYELTPTEPELTGEKG
jgi:hypothetical protein